MRISDWSSDVCSSDLLRGIVNTRLAKLEAGDYDAIVLACAGLQRLGFGERIRARLDAPDWLPAPAQGAIAIECRDDDARTIALRSEEHTSELQSLMRISYAVFCLKKKKKVPLCPPSVNFNFMTLHHTAKTSKYESRSGINIHS